MTPASSSGSLTLWSIINNLNWKLNHFMAHKKIYLSTGRNNLPQINVLESIRKGLRITISGLAKTYKNLVGPYHVIGQIRFTKTYRLQNGSCFPILNFWKQFLLLDLCDIFRDFFAAFSCPLSALCNALSCFALESQDFFCSLFSHSLFQTTTIVEENPLEYFLGTEFGHF